MLAKIDLLTYFSQYTSTASTKLRSLCSYRLFNDRGNQLLSYDNIVYVNCISLHFMRHFASHDTWHLRMTHDLIKAAIYSNRWYNLNVNICQILNVIVIIVICKNMIQFNSFNEVINEILLRININIVRKNTLLFFSSCQ